MRFKILLYVAAVKAFGFPNVFGKADPETMTCENPITYTCIEYPYVVTTWASPTKTQYIVDPNNNDITRTVTVTETPQAIVMTLTSTVTQTETETETYSRNRTRTRTIKRTISTTVTVVGEPSAPIEPMTTPVLVMGSTMTESYLPRSTSTLAWPPVCNPPSTDTSNYPDPLYITGGSKYYLRIYTYDGSNYNWGDQYLTRDGGITFVDTDAVKVFLGDGVGAGVLFAPDDTYGYGWFATDIPAVNKIFALSQYVQASGKTARTFSFGSDAPYALTWDNCGFYETPTSFVQDQDTGYIDVIFDGVTNLGATRKEVFLVGELVPPP